MDKESNEATLKIGQSYPNSIHLIKVACEAAAQKRDGMKIFGTDYSTQDGTCVRDYIHVDDLALAHVNSIEYLSAGGDSEIFNCGYGHGYSVREVIEMVKKVTGKDFYVEEVKRRVGDPETLVADTNKIKAMLNWTPQFNNLETICKSAWDWELHRNSLK